MKRIYEFITAKAKLTAKHKKELQTKRGFTEETIQKFRFFSGGTQFLKLEKEIIEKFDRELSLSSGICVKSGKNLAISPMLLDDRVIIPYMNKEGVSYYIRPHKLGLKDAGIEIYQEMNIDGRDIVITEGEFKAVASMQMGIPAVALPGIASFSNQHFSRLLKFLNDNKIRNICIIFDNEIKDDPKLQNYKENPLDRWDTPFYAYYMAKKLDKEGFNVNIGWLPDLWRVEGKADIDGALAMGKTKEDLERIISKAKTPRIFVDELPREAQNIINRKMAKQYFRTHIRKEFNRYVATRRRGKIDFDERISNFTIRILATHETPEGILREIQFKNEFGQTTPAFTIEPESMSETSGFKTFCLSKGNYIWSGKSEDLQNIWEGEFLNDDGRHIIEPDHIGWVGSEKVWLFGNVAIDKDGREMRADKSHIFWTEKKGIKPLALGVSSGRMAIQEGIPYLATTEFNIKEIQGKFNDTIGEMETSLCLGWIFAVPFLEEVFELYGCFPFLFVTGRRGSGKSTIAEWLMNFFGLENCGKMAADTTAVGMQRYLSYYSSLPVWFDEYRNTKQITMKNGFLRNAYNRQSAGKGIKSDFGVREAKIRGTLLMSGEETPEDNALLTRCIPVLVSEKRRTTNHFDWFMSNRIKFSYHILDILRRKKTLLPIFIKVLNEGKQYFVSQGSDDRTAINYACVCAGYAIMFGEDAIDFAKWVTTEAKRIQSEYHDEQAVANFLDDLIMLKTRKLINNNYWEESEGKIYLYYHGLYSIWAQEYRKIRGTEPFKSSSIRDYLKEEPGHIANNVVKKIGGVCKKCIEFDANLASDIMKALVEVTYEKGD